MIVETKRLELHELTVDDAEFIFKLVNDPSFLANIGDKGVRTLQDAGKFILEGPWKSRQPPGYGQFLVELKPDRAPIGVCGLLYREALGVTDVGIAFLPEYCRQGFGLEAASAILEYGHKTLGVEAIVGLTSKENLASIRLLDKLGMSFESMVKMTDDDPGTALFSSL